MAYTKYSLTPADNNAAPPNGAPEGMLPSAVNDTMRDMMAQIRDVGDGIRGGTYTMTAPVITGGSVTGVTAVSTSGNLTFTGTGNRITGDMNNATLANRVAFQNSVTNAGSNLNLLPNGTAGGAFWTSFGNSDPTNAAIGQFGITAGNEVTIRSSITGTGTYAPLTMYTGGSERLRIVGGTGSDVGFVGIGTSSPSTKLDVNTMLAGFGGGLTAPIATITGANSATNGGGNLRVFANTSAADNVGGSMVFGGYYSAQVASVDYVEIAGRKQSGQTTGGYMALSTRADLGNVTERMRITSAGHLLVGVTVTTAPAVGYVFNNSGALSIGRASGAAQSTILFYNGSTLVGEIRTSTTATSYLTSSDYRLKENIAPMTGALNKVAQLKPVTYTWKSNGESAQGFIAHELAEVCPDAVSGEKDATRIEQYEITPAIPATYDEEGNELTPAVEAVMGEREVPLYQGIDTSFLVATLAAAIQELKAEFDAYKATHS